jgi:hypothetical protein
MPTHSVHAQQLPAVAFDTSTALGSRIVEAPASVIQRFVDAHMPAPARHTLTAAERSKVINALNALPPLPRRVLTQRLRSISFLDGIPGNGLTIIDGTPPNTVYDIVIRGGILNETVSQFLTRKERSYYTTSGSPITLSIDGGSLDAILYVLLHESIHVIDGTTRPALTAAPMISATASPTELVAGIWDDAHTISAAYRSPLLEGTYFRTGKPASIETAEATYRALALTPFASLYGASGWYDDVAELVTLFHLTQKLHQPYRIVLRNGDTIVYSLQQMDSKLVATRFPDLAAIYD